MQQETKKTSFILLPDWPPSYLRTEKTLIFTHSYRPLSITPGDPCCTFLSVIAFVFGLSTTSAYHSVLGPRGCVWVRGCSKHTVLRARSDHVGNLSASSGGHTGWKQTQCWITNSRHMLYLCFCDVQAAEATVSPDGEGKLSSPAVTNWRSGDSKAAMELLGRMQRSPEKLLRSNA